MRAALAAAVVTAASCGSDPGAGRLPPGQAWTEGFPVYSIAGDVVMDTSEWSLSVWGMVEIDTTLSWEQFTSLGAVTDTLDFHCVTGWSRMADAWTGIPGSTVADLVRPLPGAVSVMVHSADGYTTNVLLDDFTREGVMLAWLLDGEPLEARHGYPVRLVVPHLYAYKSAKWVIGLEFLPEDEPGFWESRGYHTRGDPWAEERFEGD